MSEQRKDGDGTYQDRVEVTGRVLEVNVLKKQCQLWLDDDTYVPLAFTEEQEPRIATALKAHKDRELTARGVGEFTPDGVLKRVVSADELALEYDSRILEPTVSEGSSADDLMEWIDELFSDVPEEELARIPTDLSMRVNTPGYCSVCGK